MNPDSLPSTSTRSKARVPPTPQNLRFQRRTSERAFYETSLRDNRETATMDYPGGSSPWASSPEASRATFSGEVGGDQLPAPALREHDGERPGTGHGQNGDPRLQQGYGDSEHRSVGWSAEQQSQWQQQQHNQQQQPTQEAQRGSTEEARRPQSARYHGVPASQRQHVPQYRLQAKITGLERSGKKDPILKFDVSVRNALQPDLLVLC